jgi:hypothetical protein
MFIWGKTGRKIQESCDGCSAVLVALLPITNSFRNARTRLDTQKSEGGCPCSCIDFKFNAYMTNQKHGRNRRAHGKGINSFKLMMGYTQDEARKWIRRIVRICTTFELTKMGPPALAQIHCENQKSPMY